MNDGKVSPRGAAHIETPLTFTDVAPIMVYTRASMSETASFGIHF
jgi:hypothetical protein